MGGKVLDSETGLAIAGAQISFGTASSPTAVSDLEGNYEVWAHEEDILDGSEITVIAVRDGYQDYYYRGKPIVRQDPPGYAHDLTMIPE